MTDALLILIAALLVGGLAVVAVLSARWEKRWREHERRTAVLAIEAAYDERERQRITGVVEQTALRFGVLVPPRERR